MLGVHFQTLFCVPRAYAELLMLTLALFSYLQDIEQSVLELRCKPRLDLDDTFLQLRPQNEYSLSPRPY
ncbi:hypothetical protein KTH_47340 [Thermosporothrix hazakensis]|nr:hypothetical protein KTH_47340 [Thermosporothrix hazakensis]